MIAAPFEYQRAASLEDAIAKLTASNGTGKIIAGGHSLVPMMKMRLAQPTLLIDIARVQELTGIRESNGRIEIGACTVHHDIASSTLLQQLVPALSDAAGEIGDPQVRHCGTIGGSLAHADPAADYPSAMLALDAEILLQGAGGTRRINAGAFFQDLFTVDLHPDELIVSVSFAAARGSAYAKLHQRASHYAIVGVAAALEVRDGIIGSARIGVTGVGSHAVRLSTIEQSLAAKPATAESIASATDGAGAALTSVYGDLHASAEYRRAMVEVFARRALERALARAGAGGRAV